MFVTGKDRQKLPSAHRYPWFFCLVRQNVCDEQQMNGIGTRYKQNGLPAVIFF